MTIAWPPIGASGASPPPKQPASRLSETTQLAARRTALESESTPAGTPVMSDSGVVSSGISRGAVRPGFGRIKIVEKEVARASKLTPALSSFPRRREPRAKLLPNLHRHSREGGNPEP